MTVIAYALHTPELSGTGTAQLALTYYAPDIGFMTAIRNWGTRFDISQDADQQARQEYDQTRELFGRLMGTAHDFEFLPNPNFYDTKKIPFSFATREMSRGDYESLLDSLKQSRVEVYQARNLINPAREYEDTAKLVLDDLVSKTYRSSNGHK